MTGRDTTHWEPASRESDGWGTDTRPLHRWLADRSDAELATLLRRRPDLALPAPNDLATLAARVVVRSSVQRAVDRLDAFSLRVLAAVVAADGDGDSSPAAVAARLPEVDAAAVGTVLAELVTSALVRDDPATGELVPVGPLAAALGLTRVGLGRPAREAFAAATTEQLAPVLDTFGLPAAPPPLAAAAVAERLEDPAALRELLAAAPSTAREVLRRLVHHPFATVAPDALRLRRDPTGRASYDADPALTWLLEHGLLAPFDPRTVELPAEVGRALREAADGVTGGVPAGPRPPEVPLSDRDVDLDAVGTTAVLEALRWVDALAAAWTAAPPPVLRSGGLGVREMRRTARALGLSEEDTALVVEVAAFAGLVGPANGIDPTFLPTRAFDAWTDRPPAARWGELVRAWLTMTRQPDLVGRRDGRDKVVTALGFDVERGTVPALRLEVLGVLAQLPAGRAARETRDVLDRLAWAAPRRAGAARGAAEAVLREAAVLGVTAAGGLTGYGRAALAAVGGGAPWADVETALERALPEPVDTVLVQPDLTVVVPGQPVPDLARELALVAELESSGGAAVYRVSEASLRRAFDAGRDAPELLAFFATRSSTPVPQALQYQIEDLGRRYGALRAGAAAAYLRCDDVELLDRVLGDPGTRSLGLRRLAPTVAVTAATPAALLDALRAAGFAPAAESPTGTTLDLGAEPPRAPARRGTRPVRSTALGDDQLAELVARLRSGEELAALRTAHERSGPGAAGVPGVTSAAMLGTIREAIRASQPLWLGYVDDVGTTSARTISPISMAGGQVRGYGPDGGLETYQLHRIVAARALEADEDD